MGGVGKDWTAQRHRAGEKIPARHAQPAQAEREERVGGDEDYCSKTKTAGFASLSETTANFDGETT
jgi:hypothetical protein